MQVFSKASPQQQQVTQESNIRLGKIIIKKGRVTVDLGQDKITEGPNLRMVEALILQGYSNSQLTCHRELLDSL